VQLAFNYKDIGSNPVIPKEFLSCSFLF